MADTDLSCAIELKNELKRPVTMEHTQAWKQAIASIAAVTVVIVALADNTGESATRLEPTAESNVQRAAISARHRWNATGIKLDSGVAYRIEAVGAWTDLFTTRNANGFSSKEAPVSARRDLQKHESRRRMPGENWLALVCSVAADESRLFKVGAGRTVTPLRDGELHCFANDDPDYYWNNRGTLALTVSRVRGSKGVGSDE